MQKILFYFISFEFGLVWFRFVISSCSCLGSGSFRLSSYFVFFFFGNFVLLFHIWWGRVGRHRGCHLYIRYPKTEAPVPLLGHRFILYLSVVPAHSDSSTHPTVAFCYAWPCESFICKCCENSHLCFEETRRSHRNKSSSSYGLAVFLVLWSELKGIRY